MILHILGRLFLIPIAYILACLAAGMVLFVTGFGMEEMREVTAGDNELAFWLTLLAGAATAAFVSASSLLPAALAIALGEALKLRSWMYYIPAGGAVALLAYVWEETGGRLAMAQGPIMAGTATILLAAGFAGGLVYWLIAGRKA